MIEASNSHYLCASADNPAQATFMCFEKGCTASSFMCGRPKCPCMALHRRHQAQSIDGIFELLAIPDNSLPREVKDVEELINRTITALELLKKRHRNHMSKLASNQQPIALKSKLLRSESLDYKEVIGDSIFWLLQQTKKADHVFPSYKFVGQSLTSKLKDLQGQARNLLRSIESLWVTQTTSRVLPLIRFSEHLKKPGIELDVKCTTARTKYDGYGLLLLQPNLSTSEISKVVLRLSRIGSCLGVGICNKDIVAKQNYDINCIPCCYLDPKTKNHGVYILFQDGIVYQSNNTIKEEQTLGFKYSDGDQLRVEFNPWAKTVTYSLLGATARNYVLSVGEAQNSPESLYFCVDMTGACEVSIT